MYVTVHTSSGKRIAEATVNSSEELEEVRKHFAKLRGAKRMYVDGKPKKLKD